MSFDLIRYGALDPIYFKITLSGVGVNVTLAAGDVVLSKDGATPVDVYSECTAVDGTNMPGVFYWTPSSVETAAEVVILNIRDASAGGAFDENCIIMQTGGSSGNSRLDGT